jgi:ubiquinone/menaquinone biosynthesis C-methylase UbiE
MIAPLRMVIATDISDSLRQEAAAESYIEEFRKENAEHLSFEDGAFGFCLCKAAYHHLPRPMIGVYEMLRVANLRVALIEPNDTYFPSNFLIHAFTVLQNFGRRLLGRQVES